MMFKRSDSDLQHVVMEELKYDPRVDHAHVGVTAKDGVVTLTGHVPDYSQKISAEKAARRVYGVRGLAQEIEVRFASDPKTSDEEIARRILDILSWNVVTSGLNLTVKVEKGWVSLAGSVAWQYQKEVAQKDAGKVTGVKGVSNLIEVSNATSVRDVRERIAAAFKRTTGADAEALNISVDGSTVRLGGRVHGWNERSIAERAAWAAPGVTRVEDNIVYA